MYIIRYVKEVKAAMQLMYKASNNSENISFKLRIYFKISKFKWTIFVTFLQLLTAE